MDQKRTHLLHLGVRPAQRIRCSLTRAGTPDAASRRPLTNTPSRGLAPLSGWTHSPSRRRVQAGHGEFAGNLA
jgi:hypothetical protein